MIVINTPLNPPGAVLHEEDLIELHLVKEFGAAAIPTSAFYADGNDNKVLRFCFAKKESTLEEAAGRLERFGK